MIIGLTTIISTIIGVSEVVKGLGLNKKYIPVNNLILGTILGGLFFEEDLKLSLFMGLICGLIASGVFDQIKIFKKEE